MSEAVIDDVVAVLPPLLQAIETLGFVARNFHPPSFDRVMETAGRPDEDLSAVRPRLANWPAEFAELQNSLETASDAALAAFAGLRAVRAGQGDITNAFRALRQLPRAEEALYPLAAKFPPVSSFFLNPELCEDADLLARLAMPANEATGIMHDHNEPWRLFNLRAGILHARSCLALGNGAAWRQRQRPRLPVALAARCPQPRRDRCCSYRHGSYLGVDG
jgi:phospholipase/carboxylesterase